MSGLWALPRGAGEDITRCGAADYRRCSRV